MPSKSTPNPTLEPSFTDADQALLVEHLNRYKNATDLHGAAKKDARKKALTDANEALKRSHPSLTKAEWEVLKQV
jgi:hypothetical protein